MKKVILSLGAIFVFGIASAQTPPVTPGTTAQKQTGTTTTTDVTTQTNSNSQIKVDAIDKDAIDPVDGTQSRKDKVITNDHVKSTSAPKTGKDSTSVKRSSKSKRVKQGM